MKGRRFRAMACFLAGLVVAGHLLQVAPLCAAQDDPRLDTLFRQLHETLDDRLALQLQQEIWTLWLQSDDPELEALMQGGRVLMVRGDHAGAVTVFSRLIELAPDFAEAWNKRATVHYLMGRFDDSIADCMRVLELEPRHFGALSGLGLIHTALGNPETALYWYREALKQNPHMPAIRERAEELANEVEGEPV
ncbi:MAG: tetratricopeptide repeat protein [Alphaproteobacteria bacterium]|nr:tetratricopeptide repeat protein [Alphaproteobacteria bacterium]